jgi:hypothetical protein
MGEALPASAPRTAGLGGTPERWIGGGGGRGGAVVARRSGVRRGGRGGGGGGERGEVSAVRVESVGDEGSDGLTTISFGFF